MKETKSMVHTHYHQMVGSFLLFKSECKVCYTLIPFSNNIIKNDLISFIISYLELVWW